RFTSTSGGWVIASYLTKYFPDLVDVNFTAKTEDTLDDVSNGKVAKTPALSEFWKPTQRMIESAKDVKTTDIINNINENMHDHLFKKAGNKCPKCGGELSLKLSKYGAFVGCSNYPTCDYTQKLSNQPANGDESGEKAGNSEKDLGDGIKFKIGRFGPYVTDGTKNASAKKYTADTITLEIANELLSGEKKKAEGVELGENPATGKQILYYADGRYGAYISSNKVNVSVKSEPTLNDAIELINNKKPSTRFKKK
ncbi:MAG TPA: topoisomerase C-terminal repeat-containing protein, partial [Alphaproteobacteria bacterium]|nr:topoisomerase C-terminal repeat-containing protein [Alphaproteobacteria bacterium]